jgi:Holliday junction resolvasome RuvABC endonuclease subunit
MSIIIGVDASLTCTGVVVFDTETKEVIHSSTHGAKPRQKGRDVGLAERCRQIRDSVMKAVRPWSGSVVRIERCLSGAGPRTTAKTLMGLCSLNITLQVAFTDQGSPVQEIHVQTVRARLKRFGNVSGRVDKAQVPIILSSLVSLTPEFLAQPDLCDALALCL